MAKKTVVTVTLASLLLTTALAGCAKDTNNTASSTSSPAAASAKPAETKKYDIKMFAGRFTPNPDSENMKAINAKLGQNLIITGAPDADFPQKMNLLYAANDIPDVFASWDPEMLKNASAKYTEDDLKKYMPNLYALALKQYQAAGLSKESVFNRFTVNGKLAGFYAGQPQTTYPYGLVIRKDILDELGLKTPQTLDEYEALFKAYKQKYPNKYPLAARGKDAIQQTLYFVFAAYGVTFDTWQMKDGKLVYSAFIPEFREALATINKWYKAGFINPEWITMDNAALNNEWIAGNTIVQQFVILSTKIAAPFDPGSVYEQTAAKNPQAKMEWVAFPKAKPTVKPAISTNELVLAQPMIFGKQLEKDPDKLHAVMSMVDKLRTDKDLQMMVAYGTQGKTYDVVDGLPVIKKELNNADAQVKEGFGMLVPGGQNWEFFKATQPKIFAENIAKYAEDPAGLYSKKDNEWNFTRVNGPLITPSNEDLTPKVNNKIAEFKQLFAQVVIGTKSLEDFDKYVETFKKEIGNDMTEAANRLYLKQWQ